MNNIDGNMPDLQEVVSDDMHVSEDDDDSLNDFQLEYDDNLHVDGIELDTFI